MALRLSPSVLVTIALFALASPSEAVGIVDQTDPMPIQYRVEGGPLGDLARRYTPIELGLLEKLNRTDADHLPRLPRIVVPSEYRSELEHSPFPAAYAAAASTPKLLVVDQRTQAFAAYEHGQLVYWGPVSTGRKAKPTPSGRFHLNWRARSRLSTLSGEWRLNWYFNFHNLRGLAFHEFDLPGVPASHACVRLLTRDAKWIYQWGQSWTLDARGQLVEPGTPVVILGAYDFSSPAPYQSLEAFSTPIPLPVTMP